MKKLKSLSRHALATLIFSFGGLGGLATASAEDTMIIENPKAVLELFTSQGCSSCPPADKYLSELSKQEGLITLAYHVDYWDYIGWKDTFASKQFTKRQRNYARYFKNSSVYTPQLVVNGQIGLVGSRKSEVQNVLKATENGRIAQPNIPIELKIDGDMLYVDVKTDPKDMVSATLWAVSYTKSASVEINRGENRGRTIEYSHVVRSKTPIDQLHTAGVQHYQLRLSDLVGDDADGVVIMLQEDHDGLPGAILGAAVCDKKV